MSMRPAYCLVGSMCGGVCEPSKVEIRNLVLDDLINAMSYDLSTWVYRSVWVVAYERVPPLGQFLCPSTFVHRFENGCIFII